MTYLYFKNKNIERVEQNWSYQNIIGTTLEEVTKLANDHGYSCRVMEVDGVGYMGTSNYDICRINLIINKGIVTKAYCG